MAGMICALPHSGMDVAYNAVRTGVSGGKYDMHSGGTLVLVIEGNISKRYFCIVFVFQGGGPTIVSVVIRFFFKLELRFGNMGSMLKCRVQASAGGIRSCLRGWSAEHQMEIWLCALQSRLCSDWLKLRVPCCVLGQCPYSYPETPLVGKREAMTEGFHPPLFLATGPRCRPRRSQSGRRHRLGPQPV